MLEFIGKYIKDTSVMRRMLFAVFFLSPHLPEFWSLVVQFAMDGKCELSINLSRHASSHVCSGT